MRMMHRLKQIVRNFTRREEAEQALAAELRSHVDELTDRYFARGFSRDEARRLALIEAGGIEQVKEQVRDEWLGKGLESTWQDVRYACRSLIKKSPGFAAVIVLTLALGIGANLTMFSLLRAVLWKPLPYPNPDRIVKLRVDARQTPDTGATRGELRDLQEKSRTLEQLATIDAEDANLELGGEMIHVNAARISDNFLPLLGIRPALGRALDSRIEHSQQKDLAMLISDALWRSRFGADPQVIGRTARINNLDAQIVGVLPSGLRLYLPPSVAAAEQFDVWLADPVDAALPYRGVPVIARLRPGVSVDQANAELQTFVQEFERRYPVAYAGGTGRMTVTLLHDEVTSGVRPMLLLLSTAVAFVLLIACVNVANLMLARGSVRQRELAIRRALGAGRVRLLRQL